MMVHVMPFMSRTRLATPSRTAGRDLANVVLARSTARSGSYVDRAMVARSPEESYDAGREAELWDAIETLTAA